MLYGKQILAASLLAGVGCGVMPAFAQTAGNEEDATRLNPITVTAQKQAQSLQDVPISITAIGADRLLDTSIPRLEDAALFAPNTAIVQDPVADKINIRGIYSGDLASIEQSVSTFVDGVYHGRAVQSRFAFLDLERVEVLRGPQGVYFGKNTIGGAFNLTTAKPTPEPEVRIGAEHTFDGVEQLDLEGVISGPLGQNMRGRLAVMSRNISEGYVDNLYYGTSGPDLEELAGRASMEVDVTPNTLLSARAEAGTFDVGEQPFTIIEAGPLALFGVEASFSESRIGSINPNLRFGSAGIFDGETEEYALSMRHSFDSGSVLEGTLAHSAYTFESRIDSDFSPLDIISYSVGEEYDQTSLELKYLSDQDAAFRYTLGLYGQSSDFYTRGGGVFNVRGEGDEVGIDTLFNGACQAAIAAGADPASNGACLITGLITGFDGTPLAYTDFENFFALDQTEELWSLYASSSLDLSENWTASIGMRYTDQTKEATHVLYPLDPDTGIRNDFYGDNSLWGQFGAPSPLTALAESIIHDFGTDDLNRDEQDLSWSADLQYRPSENAMFFARYATGFKGGGFNSFALGGDPAEAEFEDESARSFEMGGRFTLADGNADLGVTAFHTTFEDIQTVAYTGAASFIVQNAAEAHSQGVEIDGRWSPTDNLQLNGSLGYLNFEYDTFPNAGCTVNQIIAFRAQSGNPLANSRDCAAVGTNDLAGRPSEHSPEWSAVLGLRHIAELPGEFTLTTYADAIYRSEQYTQADLDPVSLQDAYTKVNLAFILGPERGNWDISLIAKNVFDERTFSFANDTPLVDTAFQAIPDRPRTISVKFRWRPTL